MKVLVIIVTFNSMPWIDKCLLSVRNSSCSPDVLVVDNCSQDGTVGYIMEHFPECLLIQSTNNLGFGKANNLGLKYALKNQYDYVYLLNQDAWVFPNTIELLIKAHKLHPDYGIISPLQIDASEVHIDKTLAGLLENKLKINEKIALLRQDLLSLPLPCVMAAHWLISKDCLQETGIFSPVFPHTGEDNNYCQRVIYNQKKVGLLFSARAVHDRANRTVDQKRKVYDYCYISVLTDLSNINRPWGLCLLKSSLKYIFSLLKFHDKDVIRYANRIIAEMPSIRYYRDESKRKGAFIS